MEFRKLKAEDIECRISQITSSWCSLLLYKTSRCDMNILDETVGSMNWEREHKELKGNIYCGVSIYNKETEDWVIKWDAGKESYTESEKGEASDSFKRACVNWGIGRELYTSPSIFITPRADMTKRGKDSEFYTNEKGKVETKTRFSVYYIDYDDNRNIKDLIIKDEKGHIRFQLVSDELANRTLDLQKELHELLRQLENKDDNFDRNKVYEHYVSELDMTFIEYEDAIEICKKKLES